MSDDWDDWDDFLISGKDGGSKKYSLTVVGKQKADEMSVGGTMGDILAYISEHQPVSSESISNELDISGSIINKSLDILKRQRLVTIYSEEY